VRDAVVVVAAAVAAVAAAAAAAVAAVVVRDKEPKKQRCTAISHRGMPFLKVVFLFAVVAYFYYITQIVYITKHYICIWSIL
jgi:hypothetical protein